MTDRSHISTRERAKIFERNGGVCHLCKGLVHIGEKWDVSHDRPLGLLGEDDDKNRKVAHRKCHKVQTDTVDIPAIAKATRKANYHSGAKAPPKRKIKSRGFPKKERTPKTVLPPLELYEDATRQ